MLRQHEKTVLECEDNKASFHIFFYLQVLHRQKLKVCLEIILSLFIYQVLLLPISCF